MVLLTDVSGSALPFLPVRSGYAFNSNSELITANVNGGLSRSRKDFVGGGNIVDVEYVLTAGEFDFFMKFYDLFAGRGANNITAPLILNQKEVTEYPCKFVPNSLRVSEPNGSRYVVTAQLEVSNPVDPTLGLADFYLDRERLLEGQVQYRYNFRGANEESILFDPAPEVTGNYTFTCWVKNKGLLTDTFALAAGGLSPAVPEDRCLIAWEGGVGAGRWFIAHENQANGVFYNGAAFGPPVDTWRHYCFLRTSFTTEMYIDNVLAASDTVVALPNMILGRIGVGQATGDATAYFTGEMYQAKFFNKALVANEREWVYTDGASGTEPAPAAEFDLDLRMNEGAGSSCYDLSVNKRVGTIESLDLDGFHLVEQV